MWSCVAIDPGGVSGWCALSVHDIAMRDPGYQILDNIALVSVGEYSGDLGSQVNNIINLFDCWTEAEYVIEDFILRTHVTSREVLDPVRITAAVTWWLGHGERAHKSRSLPIRTIHTQSPSLAMTTVTDDRLKEANLYALTVGKPHGRDALRHALTWARRAKSRPRARARATA